MSNIIVPNEDRSGKENYIKTLNSSQIYMEIMDPWDMGAIGKEYRVFVKEQLAERKEDNLKNIKMLRGIVRERGKKRRNPGKKFSNYFDFKKYILNVLKPLYKLDFNPAKYSAALKETEKIRRAEKIPKISKENVQITFYGPDNGVMVMSGIKDTQRSLEKISKKIVYNEKTMAENIEKHGGNKFDYTKMRRDAIREKAQIKDIARIRAVLTGKLSEREKEAYSIYSNLKKKCGDRISPEKFVTEPYPRMLTSYEDHMREYAPRDKVSIQIMGIKGLFDDVFGENCHTIYEIRSKNRIYVPGTQGEVYEFSKKEILRAMELTQRAIDFLS